MTDTTTQKIFLRPEHAGPYIGLSKSTLDKMRVYGTGPTFSRLGRAVVYCRDDLNAWVEQRRVASTSEAGLLPRRIG